jgi:manganese efflux pump family protein
MIATILIFGFLAGLDNLKVCSSVGLLPISRSRMRILAAGFILCETAAPLAGLLAGHAVLKLIEPFARIAGPLMTVICGAAVFAVGLRGERDSLTGDSRLLFGLPLSLSLDNLVAGAGISPLPCPVWAAALLIGLISGGMSCAGLYGAARLRDLFRRIVPARADLLTGAYLCVLALRMLLVDRT